MPPKPPAPRLLLTGSAAQIEEQIEEPPDVETGCRSGEWCPKEAPRMEIARRLRNIAVAKQQPTAQKRAPVARRAILGPLAVVGPLSPLARHAW